MSRTDEHSQLPRVAVWGLGRMGLRHAEHVCDSRRAQLVGVADIDSERSSLAAEKLKVPAYGGLDELLEACAPDGVIVATHVSDHAKAIEVAAARSVHVFCEKPLASDGAAAARVLSSAEAEGIHVQMGFQMRFDRDLARLASAVRDGELGRIFQLRSTVRDAASPTREYLESSGGYYRDTAVHCLDYGRWLVGEVEQVLAAGVALSDPVYAELGDVDNAAIIVRFESGTLGTINLSRVCTYGFDTAVEVLGARGAVRVPGARVDGLEHYEAGRVSWRHVPEFLERFEDAYAEEVDAFAALLAGHGTGLAASGRDGLAAMRVAEAAVLSHERRAAVDVAEIPW